MPDKRPDNMELAVDLLQKRGVCWQAMMPLHYIIISGSLPKYQQQSNADKCLCLMTSEKEELRKVA